MCGCVCMCMSQAAARQWRHQQLLQMAVKAGCGFLALGHTATERAETVLFNLIRWDQMMMMWPCGGVTIA